MVVCACEPSYKGDINGRTAVQASHGQKLKTLSEILTKAKIIYLLPLLLPKAPVTYLVSYQTRGQNVWVSCHSHT
jgi:hypothetical protein